VVHTLTLNLYRGNLLVVKELTVQPSLYQLEQLTAEASCRCRPLDTLSNYEHVNAAERYVERNVETQLPLSTSASVGILDRDRSLRRRTDIVEANQGQ
jgi:hypothetical protein